MTTTGFDRLTRLKLIFSALKGERFVRRPLVLELIELASEEPCFEELLSSATQLLRDLDASVESAEFNRHLRRTGVELAHLEEVTKDAR